MSTSEFKSIVERLAKAKGASTPRQLDAIVKQVAAKLPIYAAEASFSDAGEMAIGFQIDKAIEADARLAMRVPTVAEVVDAVAADAVARGLPMSTEQKITLRRELAGADPDALLDKLPNGVKLSKSPAVSQPSSTPAGNAWTTEALDAEVLKRFGKHPHEITGMDRKRYHDAIRAESKKTATPINDQLRSGRDPKTLSASERVEAFREEQRAKGQRA